MRAKAWRETNTTISLQKQKRRISADSRVFEETARNEKEHAKIWFKKLNGINDTLQNLDVAAEGENYEWTDMYAKFAKEAREEGSMTSQNYLTVSPLLKRPTRKDIEHLLRTSRAGRCLRERRRKFGNAETAAIE